MPNNIIKSFADKSGKTEEEVEKLWNELKTEYKDDYEKITGTLKKILNIDEVILRGNAVLSPKNKHDKFRPLERHLIYKTNKYKLYDINKYIILTDTDDNQLFYIKLEKKDYKTITLGARENLSNTPNLFFKVIYTLLYLGYRIIEDWQHNDLSIKSIQKLIKANIIKVKYDNKDITKELIDNNFNDDDINKTFSYELKDKNKSYLLENNSMFENDDLFELSDKLIKNTILNIDEDNGLLESTNIKSIKEKFKDYFKKINIYEYNDKVSIDLIITNEKNQGYGTKLMNEIVDYCDKTNKTIILTPSDEFGGNKKRLIEFYKRFGFLENKGKNKIFDIFESMYKLPKNKTNENYKGLNMEVKEIVEGLSKLKLNFVTKAMIAEKVESLDEAKLNEYLDTFEEYKNSVMESEKFAELVKDKEVDSLTESEIEDLIEACSKEMEEEEEDDKDDKDDKDEEDDKKKDIEDKENDKLEENFIGKAMLELSKGNTGSAIEMFKNAMLNTLSKNETYKEIDSKMSLYMNEADDYSKMLKQAKKDLAKIIKFEDKIKFIKVHYPSYKDKLMKDLELE